LLRQLDEPSPESLARVEQLREEARQYIADLQPANDDETSKQQRWLAEVDQCNEIDFANFQLYREFSRPTLGDTRVPQGATYGEVLAYGEQMGWLEFRFGKGLLGEGYYDANSSISEIRFTPCPPDQLAEREAIVLRRFQEIASELGVPTKKMSSHPCVSVYTHESSTSGEARDPFGAQPVVGFDVDRTPRTLDVISGIGAAIEDGVFMSELSQEPALFGRKQLTAAHVISTHRTAVRLHPDYIELRSGELQNATAHDLLWLMAGMAIGLQHGKDGLARQGYVPAQQGPILLTEATPAFVGESYRPLQRALEDSQILPGGYLRTAANGIAAFSKIFRSVVLEDESIHPSMEKLGVGLFLTCVQVNPQGALWFDRQMFETLCASYQQSHGGNTGQLCQATYLDKMEAYIQRDALRVRTAQAVGLAVRLIPRPAAEWQAVWQSSPVMRAAYSSHTERHASYLVGLIEQQLSQATNNQPDTKALAPNNL
jgi:hypothetical protein